MVDQKGQNNQQARLISAYFVPEGLTLETSQERRYGSYSLQFPELSGENIAEACAEVLKHRKAYLANLTTEQIIERIDQAVQLWLNPDYPLRKIAEQVLPTLTGYDEETIRLELKRYMRGFRKKELYRFLDEEFDNPGLLDGFRPRKTGGRSRAYGPELIFHVFSGNVPGLPLWSMIMGLLLKAGGIGKSSSSEPLMPVLFAQSLAQVDRELANCLAILPWKGGTEDLEEPVLKSVDAVIVYGSNETVQRIQERVTRKMPVLGYGHKVSFAAIGREALTTDRYQDTVHRLAHDVMIYDQQSCLSPQAVWVEEGGVIGGRQFAQLLAAELENYKKRRPRAKLTDEEAIAIRSVRNRYEALSFQDEDIEVYASQGGTEWTVIYEGKPGLEGSPLNRTIHVYACQELKECIPYLRPYRDYLQTVGLAVSPRRLEDISTLLAREGVTRITALGQMTLGVPGWHHDGRFNLLDLVRFVDLERSAEQLAEMYDPDVEAY